MRVKRLFVSGWKSLADVTIEFEDDVTVLLGRNATGKSSGFCLHSGVLCSSIPV